MYAAAVEARPRDGAKSPSSRTRVASLVPYSTWFKRSRRLVRLHRAPAAKRKRRTSCGPRVLLLPSTQHFASVQLPATGNEFHRQHRSWRHFAAGNMSGSGRNFTYSRCKWPSRWSPAACTLPPQRSPLLAPPRGSDYPAPAESDHCFSCMRCVLASVKLSTYVQFNWPKYCIFRSGGSIPAVRLQAARLDSGVQQS